VELGRAGPVREGNRAVTLLLCKELGGREFTTLGERGVRRSVAINEVGDEFRVREHGNHRVHRSKLAAAQDGLESPVAADETDCDLDGMLALVQHLDVVLVAGGRWDGALDLQSRKLAIGNDGGRSKSVDAVGSVAYAAKTDRRDADAKLAAELVLNLEQAASGNMLDFPEQRLQMRIHILVVDYSKRNGPFTSKVGLDADGRGAG